MERGIYILETEGPEYRVADVRNIDEIWKKPHSRKLDFSNSLAAIKVARSIWTGKVYKRKVAAINAAVRLHQEKKSPRIICSINIPQKF